MRWLVLMIGALASSALAQTPKDGSRTSTDTIVVTGNSGAVRRSYVDRVARPEPGRQLARWHVPLCIRYDGLDEKISAFIQARIAEMAKKVRLGMAGPKCPAAVLVKLTDQADVLAKALVHMNPPRLGSVTSGMLPSQRSIKAIEVSRTVRWITASATVSSDGVPINGDTNSVWMDSLIRSTTREDLLSKIILIDAVRLADVSLNQLADYIAFITLASPDVAADFSGTDSIMALFAGASAGPRRMTQQDLAFLEALYVIPSDRPAATQKGAIRTRIGKRSSEAEHTGQK